MPASKALIEQLLALGEHERGELGDLLLDTKDADRFALAQILLDSVDDGMTESERAELDAAIEESYTDMEAGRMRPADEVIAELRARSAQRAAG